jgi:NAD(P)-dependent dehydrogenase (short-subunit alcohol dehydrogenase family)
MKKAACVIGSEGGVGSALVRQLDESGAWGPILQMDRNGSTRINVADPESIDAAFRAAREHVPRLDLLVICSGILDLCKLRELTIERWNEVLAVNLTGPFLCCQLAQDWLLDNGRIVLIGSLAGRTGGVLTGTAYAVSKGGIESLTKSLAQELAPRSITVNCVAPGGVDTPMLAQNSPATLKILLSATPLKRMATPDEIASAIVFLASEGAGYITGAVIPVNGGIRMD